MSLGNHPSVLGSGASQLNPSGATVVGGPTSSTDNALVRWNGTNGQLIQNGVVTEADDTGTLTGPTANATVTAIGSAFTNQPANDGIEVLSSSAADTTQTATVIGTTNGGNVVVVETVALAGTTPVATVKTDWGLILAVKLSASCAGTITFREASADQTITTVLTTVLSKGVNTVAAANQPAYNRTVSAVSDGATTKQIGYQGTDTSGAVIYDSKPLNGATAVASNSSFRTLTEIYTGDVEVARTETITTNGAWALTAGAVTITATGTNQGVTLVANGTGINTLTGNASISGKTTSYNGVATAGWGVEIVQADGAIAGTVNGRSAAVATYTVGAADGTFVVSGNVNVTTATAHSFSLDCVYTDETNTSRTLVMPLAQLAGTFVATGLITNITGAGPYESASMTIRCKAATSITLRPSAGGTYTTVTYNVAGNIRQVG